MKTLVAVVLVVVAGLLAYNYFTDGEARLDPRQLSEDELAVERLQERFDQARRRFSEAVRAAGVSGEDLAAEAEAARREVERVRAQLQERLDATAKQVGESGDDVRRRVREKAERLEAAIRAFKKELE